MDISGYAAIALTNEENSFIALAFAFVCDIGDIINVVSASYTGSNINRLTIRPITIHIAVRPKIVVLPFITVSIIYLVLISSIV